jgi:hypothetical protein
MQSGLLFSRGAAVADVAALPVVRLIPGFAFGGGVLSLLFPAGELSEEVFEPPAGVLSDDDFDLVSLFIMLPSMRF